MSRSQPAACSPQPAARPPARHRRGRSTLPVGTEPLEEVAATLRCMALGKPREAGPGGRWGAGGSGLRPLGLEASGTSVARAASAQRRAVARPSKGHAGSYGARPRACPPFLGAGDARESQQIDVRPDRPLPHPRQQQMDSPTSGGWGLRAPRLT